MKGQFIYWLGLIVGVILIVIGLGFILMGSYVPSLPTAVPPTKIKVVASIFPLADFVRNVGGDKVEVITLLPTGASPHTYEPTPGQVKEIAKAKVFVKNGLGLEFWAEKIVKAAGNSDLIVVDTSQGIALVRGDLNQRLVKRGILPDGTVWEIIDGGTRVNIDGVTYCILTLEVTEGRCSGGACKLWSEVKQQIESSKDDHEHGVNPHIWLDPILAQQQVKTIAQALIQADPANNDFYERNMGQYLAELEDLDRKIREITSTFSRREFICFHPAWTYFAQRYGLVEAAVIEVAPGKEASPTHIRKIVDTAKKLRVRTIFAEPQFNPKAAQRIAEEVSAKVLFLDPLGGPELKDRNSYWKLMIYNLEQLNQAMGSYGCCED